MRILVFIFSILLSFTFSAQEEIVVLKTPTGELEGSLSLPEQKSNIPVVLIIAGSGPTDRNGNNEEMQNNSLKMVAEELKKNGIASLRYDKRGVGQSSDVDKDESQMRPLTFSNDAKAWIDLLSTDKRFTKIIVAGHSEGSLLGTMASVNNTKVSGFISIAGPGRPIDQILKEQFSHVPDHVKEIIYGMIDQLKKGDTLREVPTIFYAIFRPSVQPYLRAWMQIDPAKELKKLKIPVMILGGSTDIQVKEVDARLLVKAQPKAEFHFIKNMNHVLKNCDTLNKELQKQIYNNPDLTLNEEFCEELISFITQNFLAGKPVTSPVNKN